MCGKRRTRTHYPRFNKPPLIPLKLLSRMKVASKGVYLQFYAQSIRDSNPFQHVDSVSCYPSTNRLNIVEYEGIEPSSSPFQVAYPTGGIILEYKKKNPLFVGGGSCILLVTNVIYNLLQAYIRVSLRWYRVDSV